MPLDNPFLILMNFTLDGYMPVPFTMKRLIQFAETDMAGVLHFSNYYRLMEEIEHAFWRSLETSVLAKLDNLEVTWPRVSTSCEYFSPARFEDEITLSLKIAHVGDRSMTYEVEFHRDDEPLAKGKVTVVCCTMKDGTFQSLSIPDPLREKLSAFSESELPT